MPRTGSPAGGHEPQYLSSSTGFGSSATLGKIIARGLRDAGMEVIYTEFIRSAAGERSPA